MAFRVTKHLLIWSVSATYENIGATKMSWKPFHITCPLGREIVGQVDSPNKELIL